jgi:predicted porin
MEITDLAGAKTKRSVSKNRYAISAEYVSNDWTVRSEYIHSQGFDVAHAKGDKADGFYALAIAPIVKNKLHVKARYDVYRDEKTWGSSKTYYEVGADYVFTKHLQLNIEYARVNERTTHDNYNLLDVQLDVRF